MLFTEFFRKLSARRFELYRDEVTRRNLSAMRSYLAVGVLVTLANFFSQLVLYRTITFGQVVGLLAYYTLLALVNRWLAHTGRNASTLLMYLIQLPPMLLGIVMGTALDPHNAAITFLMFLVTIPLFLLDKPWRVVAYETALSTLFTVAAYLCKDPEVFRLDMVHLTAFYSAAVAMTLFVLSDRIDAAEAHVRLLERSEHDELTGLKNRFALRADFGSYVGKPLCVMMSDVDYFKSFNDRYGHQVGDDVLSWFAEVFEAEFVVGSCYRYGGDELLLIAEGWDPQEFRATLERCQRKLGKGPASWVTERQGISCSCGFVHGTPRTEEELRRMITQADHCLYEVKESGRGSIVGKRFE